MKLLSLFVSVELSKCLFELLLGLLKVCRKRVELEVLVFFWEIRVDQGLTPSLGKHKKKDGDNDQRYRV